MTWPVAVGSLRKVQADLKPLVMEKQRRERQQVQKEFENELEGERTLFDADS